MVIKKVINIIVFDFKARGQWKHWNDVIKNTEIADEYDVANLLVPTIDSSRYNNILESALNITFFEDSPGYLTSGTYSTTYFVSDNLLELSGRPCQDCRRAAILNLLPG